MPILDAVFAGVDPSSAHKAYTYAVLDVELRVLLLSDGEIEDLLGSLAPHQIAVAAINSPSGVNRGLVRERRWRGPEGPRQIRGADIRLAEHELRAAGVAVAGTPSRLELCPGWVRSGFQAYGELRKLGFQQTTSPSAERRLIETHPEACFRLILGRNPLPKPTLEGRLQRQAALHERGLRLTDPMTFFEEITRYRLIQGALPVELIHLPDQLDALVAALTAWMLFHDPASISMVGAEDEGQIVLPGLLAVPAQ